MNLRRMKWRRQMQQSGLELDAGWEWRGKQWRRLGLRRRRLQPVLAMQVRLPPVVLRILLLCHYWLELTADCAACWSAWLGQRQQQAQGESQFQTRGQAVAARCLLPATLLVALH